MSYMDKVHEDAEEKRQKDGVDWGVVGKLCLIFLVVIFSFVAGTFSNEYKGENQCVSECKNVYAPNYAAGVVDQYLRHMNAFILNCTPTNVEAFVLADPATLKESGTMLRCNESILPVKFARQR